MTWPQFGAAVGIGIGIGIESVHTELNGLPNAISIRSISTPIPIPTPILVNGYEFCNDEVNKEGYITNLRTGIK